MKAKKRLGVGVIGLGRIFLQHLNSIKELPGLELKAVCDIKADLARQVGDKEKVNYYKDYRDLIADSDVDIVAVCTPNFWHFPMGIAVAKAGKHCVMEKPLAQNYQKAVKLVSSFDKSKGKIFPVLQVRYNPSVRVLRDSVNQGLLGKIHTASLIVRWTRPQEYFDESDWKGTIKMDGGSLLTQAIHYIDVMQHILGSAKSIFAKSARVAHKTETEDIANAIIDFKSGARANVEFTICAYPHNLECSLTVLGEKGSIKIGGVAMNKCELWEVENYPQPTIPDGLMPNIYGGGLYTGSCPNHKSIYQSMLDELLYNKKTEVKITGKEALESVKIIDGIKKSSKNGKEIKL